MHFHSYPDPPGQTILRVPETQKEQTKIMTTANAVTSWGLFSTQARCFWL